jgi:uncharacterized protein YcbX
VARISITPVKGTALQTVPAVRLEPFGVLENRRFYFVDERGEHVNGPKHGRLMQVRSSWSPETEVLRLEFPDGSAVEEVADRIDGPQLVTDFYGRPVRGHAVVGPFSDAVSEWYEQPLRLIRTDTPGTANDVKALSLMSTASARALAEASDSALPLETGRFRMLFELQGCAPFEEDTWAGRLLRLGPAGDGAAVIRVGGQIPRCAVTTYDPRTGVRDFGTLHAIKRVRGANADGKLPFGVYGEVVEPGTVRVGDPVEPPFDAVAG